MPREMGRAAGLAWEWALAHVAARPLLCLCDLALALAWNLHNRQKGPAADLTSWPCPSLLCSWGVWLAVLPPGTEPPACAHA